VRDKNFFFKQRKLISFNRYTMFYTQEMTHQVLLYALHAPHSHEIRWNPRYSKERRCSHHHVLICRYRLPPCDILLNTHHYQYQRYTHGILTPRMQLGLNI
jgi:hypothetical protein